MSKFTENIKRAAPECFLNPGTLIQIRPYRKPVYVLQIVSNDYQTSDRITYNQVNNQIYIKAGAQTIQFAEKISDLDKFNQAHVENRLKIPHYNYGIKIQDGCLVKSGPRSKAISIIADYLRLASFLLESTRK